MYKAYKEMNFKAETLLMIKRANELIADYAQDGLILNLRQMHYQFVSRNWYANTDKNYDLLGRTLTNARECGLVSWTALEDQERELVTRPQWKNAQRFMEIVMPQFHIDMWDNQPRRVEVWVEKKALLNAVRRVCHPLDVPYIACKGYMSATEEWLAGQRIKRYAEVFGQETTIIYLGDHDPSGIHMTEDHITRLARFAERPVDVRRVGLNYDQVLRYKPPTNPTKDKDSRSPEYIATFWDAEPTDYCLACGDTKHAPNEDCASTAPCWELDALSPRLISLIVKRAILDVRDNDAWDVRVEFFKQEQLKLAKAANMNVEDLETDDDPLYSYEEEELDDEHEEEDDESEEEAEDRARREYTGDDGVSDPFDD